MKKTLLAGLALGAVLTAGIAFAYTDANTSTFAGAQGDKLNRHGNDGGAGIIGSSHDLSGTSGQGGYTGASVAEEKGRICIYCHHPHHAMTPAEAGGYSPLWNREVNTTANAFAAYDNGMMMNDDNGYPSTLNTSNARNWMNGTPEVGGVSLLCMSCHDGATAMNAYSDLKDGVGGDSLLGSESFISAGGTGVIGGGAALAQGSLGLSNHHPIGMTWANVVAADAEIAPAATEYGTVVGASALPNPQTGGASIGVSIEGLLYDGKMECVTCHDVHNTQNAAGSERFLWVSNENSAFCLTCHLK